MVGQIFSAFLRKSAMFRLGIFAGLIGLLIGCGGGGDGTSSFSSVGDGAAGDGDIPPAVDQAPMATIFSPIDSFFNEGENIVFSGTGTDAEDGQLTDGALVWTSSMDGSIGNGATLITGGLTPGDHDITLTATDSNGASFSTVPVLVHVEPTRFLKIGPQTTGVTDASNAFDGDYGSAATITTSETEYIHFKAYIGGADTFLFRIKAGVSTIGSSLTIEGLTEEDAWQLVSDIALDTDKTVTVKVVDAQDYKDADGYINLRALLVNDQSPDTVPIYELWRVDPVFAQSWSTGVDDADWAFDGDRSQAAVINNPSITMESPTFLGFRTYVGSNQADTFTFNILLNSIGPPNSLVVEAEEMPSGNWKNVSYLSLDTTETRTVSVQNIQSYLDEDGYISLRTYWVGLKTPGTVVQIYEIWRNDPFLVGPKTTFAGPVVNAQRAVDSDLDSFAEIHYFWNELGHQDFLHLRAYVGDTSPIKFTIVAGMSAPPDAEVIVDGEYEPDHWSIIESFSIDDKETKRIELPNSREFVDADGYLNLRVRWDRWESDTMNQDAYIYEIQREED
jgi:hypothetical protein